MRAVYEDDVIKMLNEGWARGIYPSTANVHNLPPAEPRWIPCSERLPEVKQKVLVQYADESMATKKCNDAGHLAWFYSNAVAWMPAPEPYREVTT